MRNSECSSSGGGLFRSQKAHGVTPRHQRLPDLSSPHPMPDPDYNGSNSPFGLSLVSPTLEGGIQHPIKVAIGVMYALSGLLAGSGSRPCDWIPAFPAGMTGLGLGSGPK